MLRRALALVVLLTGCSAPPAPVAPPMADLEIKKMPDAGGARVAPKPVVTDAAYVTGGKCGEAAEGQTAPPLTPSIKVGKVTIVFFWATWAGPAALEMEKLQALYSRHRATLDIIALSVDDEKQGVFPFAKQHGAGYTVAWDEDHRAAECWRVPTMPATYVIDREGVVRHLHHGYQDGEVDVIEGEIAKL